MKTSVNNNIVNSVREVKLSQIVASTYNQRKFFDEQALKDLSESILQHGILQPVLLRKVGKKFEIVYGERRFRAAQLAGLSTIPANIRELTDGQALEMSVIENLQRENIKPMEESAGFIALLETKKYDYAALAKKIGKSEVYVRNRVKLNDLITEVATMIDNEEVNIGIGLMIATYPEDIQYDVYLNHLKVKSGYSWWGKLSTVEFKRSIESTYSLLLENYQFDKSQCVNCPHNTDTYNIFPADGDAKCTKRPCLIEKNTKYIISESVNLANEENIQYFLVEHNNNIDDSIFEAFEKEGLVRPDRLRSAYYPEAPEVPTHEEYDNEEDYQIAMDSFREEYKEYEADMTDFNLQLAEGSIVKCVIINRNRVMIEYVEGKVQEDKPQKDDDDDDSENTEIQDEHESPVRVVDNSPLIRTLKKQDGRNKEIVIEHILEDAKSLMKNLNEYSGELTDLEIKMMYYFMMSSMSREKERVLIPDKDFALPADRVRFVENNLTKENMSIIVREYLRVNFHNQAYRGSTVTNHFLEFVQQHCPEDLAEITQKYNDIYEKRKQRIDEQLAELTTPISKTDTSVEVTEQPSDEPLPESSLYEDTEQVLSEETDDIPEENEMSAVA